MPAESLRTFRLRVAYDGSGFVGFQAQPAGKTVQSVIEEAIWRLTSERVKIGYAGRTDTGVHAVGQVVTFSTSSGLTDRSVVAGMNANLPETVVVWEAKQVDPGFDPRRQALSRTYRYLIENTAWPTPHRRRLCWHVREELDTTAMNTAAQALVGERDLAALTEKSGAKLPSTVRTIARAEVARRNEMVTFEIEANAFLPHLVRNTVGTLVWIGRGRRSVDDMQRILASKDRTSAGPAAPGHGLYLLRVRYPDDQPAKVGEGATW